MPDYKAPIRDIQFVRDEVLNFSEHYAKLPGCEEVTPDLVEAIINEAAKFAENVLAPLNRSGDEEGCQLIEGEVKTPEGFKEAYQQFIEGGWPSLSSPAEFGGQGLPSSLDMIVTEMNGQANHAWAMYPGLSEGARNTLHEHGTDEQRQVYLTKLIEGSWTGTMCLTEPQGGSDLSFLRTKAEPQDDGTYSITGTKIFISSGEHDMAENIVHIVLARLPDAPAGTRGISLFIVPKFLPNAEGEVGERNAVSCGSLEHKMGIHANATCVMNFDGARGYLIGEVNKGLNCMFTFMNVARIGTALQGLSHAEVAYQGGLTYATERLAGRSLSGPKNPDGPADPLIVHPDVRRMLMTCKAFAESHRMFTYYMGQITDVLFLSTDEAERKKADDMLSFLTPIAKGFMTETGLEAANHGVQIYGGHGFIREWGMEQNVRDSRISTLYEGTTGIQSLDLLGRKVLGSGGKLLALFAGEVLELCGQIAEEEALAEYGTTLGEYLSEWEQLTRTIGERAVVDANEVGAVSVDYLMYSGYVVSAFFWAKMAMVAKQKMTEGTDEELFYRSKLATASFYFKKLLPRAKLHAAGIMSGADSLMELSDDDFVSMVG